VKTWDDYEKGCLASFGGGYRTQEDAEIFQHGMRTIFNLLRNEFPAAEQCKSAQDLLEACEVANAALATMANNGNLTVDEWSATQQTLSNAIRKAAVQE